MGGRTIYLSPISEGRYRDGKKWSGTFPWFWVPGADPNKRDAIVVRIDRFQNGRMVGKVVTRDATQEGWTDEDDDDGFEF